MFKFVQILFVSLIILVCSPINSFISASPILPFECNTDWYNNTSCGLNEYVNSNGETIFVTVSDPAIADIPHYYYDCTGNLICEYGGYYILEMIIDENGQIYEVLPDGVCDEEFAGQLNGLTFVQNIVPCISTFQQCNTDWFDPNSACGLDEYVNAFGETVYKTTPQTFPGMSDDEPEQYFDCTGNWICSSNGEILPEWQCDNTFLQGLTFVQTIQACSDACNTDWYNNTACGLDEYVNAFGETIYKTTPQTFPGMSDDEPEQYFDCTGNWICSSNGEILPEWQCDNTFLQGLTFVQTIQACSDACNTDWYNNTACGLDEYVNAFGETIYKTTPQTFPGMSDDEPEQYFDCTGNWICSSNGEILPEWQCDNTFLQGLTFVQTIQACSDACNTDWYNGNACGLDEYVNSMGETIFITTTDPMIADVPHYYYDCFGNLICEYGGYYLLDIIVDANGNITEVLPDGVCEEEFSNQLQGLTFVQTIHECTGTIFPIIPVCEDADLFTLEIKALLEGQWNGTVMNNALADAGLLPFDQPFNGEAWGYYAGIETLDYIAAPEVVDWVMICLRDINGNEVEKVSALIDGFGNVMNYDGSDCIPFYEADINEQYLISIHHNGHISVMSSEPVANNDLYDFTTSADKAEGLEAMKFVNGAWVLFGGDYDNNGIINSLDFNNWANNSALVNVYTSIDIDGNGIVNNLDYNVWEINRSKIGLPLLYD